MNNDLLSHQPPHSGETASERFWQKVEVTEDCWWWVGCRGDRGHGYFWFDGKTIPAYRFSYEAYVGEIPDGLDIDHLCANPFCVRPEHLEPVTKEENGRRAARRQKGL